MVWRGIYLKVFWLWTAISPFFAYSQIQGRPNAMVGVDAAGNSQTIEAALHQMSDQAAVIFVGTVADVQRKEGNGIGSGVVEIRFDLEQPIRGCSGSSYTLREWGGLWAANDARFHVGEHLLMLLHAPSSTGLSSPVGGMDGAIPLRASGAGVRPADASTASAEPVADLRWIGAKLTRTMAYANASTASGVRARSTSPVPTHSSEPQASSIPAQESAVSAVTTMMRSWQGKSNATR